MDTYAEVDVEQPNLKTYPAMARARALETTLEPGPSPPLDPCFSVHKLSNTRDVFVSRADVACVLHAARCGILANVPSLLFMFPELCAPPSLHTRRRALAPEFLLALCPAIGRGLAQKPNSPTFSRLARLSLASYARITRRPPSQILPPHNAPAPLPGRSSSSQRDLIMWGHVNPSLCTAI